MSSRRKFILKTLAGISGLAFTERAFPQIVLPQKKDRLGVALVGLGRAS